MRVRTEADDFTRVAAAERDVAHYENGVPLEAFRKFAVYVAENLREATKQLSRIKVNVKVLRPKGAPRVYRLISVNYTNKCRRWGRPEARLSRGLYISQLGDDIVSFYSPTKFFNVNEREGWFERELASSYRLREVTVKHGGTLLIVFRDPHLDRWVYATRRYPHFYFPKFGYCSSADKVVHPQIARALELAPQLRNIPQHLEDYVLLFEVVDPDWSLGDFTLGSSAARMFEKRAAVYFITARRTGDFRLLSYRESAWIASELGLPQVEHVDANSLADLLGRGEKVEGYVLWFEREGEAKLAKVKTATYVAVTKLLNIC